MSKSICALVHRPGSTRAEFQTYYEENHAPLAAQHFPFTRYARNHLMDGEDLGFDTISEFWAKDIAAAAALMNGPVGDILRADEAKFMDQTRIASGSAEEHVLSPGRSAGPDAVRTAFLISPGSSGDAWREAALSLGRALAAVHAGTSLDFVQSWGPIPFPASAVLWVPGAAALPDAPAPLSIRRVLIRREETAPEQLRQAV